ncbi:hypothetical protein [Campylobacter cuniculorum]|uniref:hypothetical protein n=1 Tax=Campylobacter cuniculorum TaxID=374106 RepID=UPI0004817E7E|nr:hypothetical protein [Campylobacter cuniculorum]
MVDPAHQHITIMQELGENIANHADDFLSPKKMDLKNKINFTILTPQDMIVDGGGDLKSFEAKNSMFDEKVFRIEEHKLFFPEQYFGHYILALNA